MEPTCSKKNVFTFLAILSTCFELANPLAHANEARDLPFTIETSKTHTRLGFDIDKGIPVEWKENRTGFEILFKGASANDFGIPLSTKKEANRYAEKILNKFHDKRLKSITLNEEKEGVKVVGKWKFPLGKDRLANEIMLNFQFRSVDPPKYILDFWVKPSPTYSSVKIQEEKELKIRIAEQGRALASQRVHQRNAALKFKNEKNDVLGFCKDPLSDEKDVFLTFKEIHKPIEFEKWFNLSSPDADFDYYEQKTDENQSDESKYNSFALKLYRDKKYGLVVKTADFFLEKFKISPYREQILFLKANSFFKLKLIKESNALLEEIVATELRTMVSLQASTFLAIQKFNEGNPVEALNRALSLMARFSDHDIAWIFHFIAAEVYFKIRKTDDAIAEYKTIESIAPKPSIKALAAFRIGNVYFSRKNYERAVAAYYAAIMAHPKEVRNFPEVLINRFEALALMGERDRAFEEGEKILNEFGFVSEAWRVTYRLGLIAGRKPQPMGGVEMRKWFLDTINLYPGSPGSFLARLQSFPCDKNSGIDAETMNRFFDEEAEKFDGNHDMYMIGFDALRAKSHFDTLITYGFDRDAILVGLYEIKRIDNLRIRKQIQEKMSFLFRKIILDELAKGNKYKALDYYHKMVDEIPGLNSDPDYLIQLSKVATDLGLESAAGDILSKYEEVNQNHENRKRAIASIELPKDPDEQWISSVSSYLKARSLWKEEGVEEAKSIKEALTLVRDDSKYSFEKQIILSLLENASSNQKQAIVHAAKAQLLLSSNQDSENLEDRKRILSWMANLNAKYGEKDHALVSLSELEKLSSPKIAENEKKTIEGRTGALGLPAVLSLEEIYFNQAEIHALRLNWEESAKVLSRAVKSGVGGQRAEYELARSLAKTGRKVDRTKAFTIYKKIAEVKEDSFWKRAASDAVANEELQNNL